jgi:hypothetical protein
VTATLVAGAACGSAGAPAGTVGGAGGGSGGSRGQAGNLATGGSSGTADGGATTALVCPASAFAPGSECTTVMQCTWGNDPLPECRSSATCDGARWSYAAPAPYCPTFPPCPGAMPGQQRCSDTSLTCIYRQERAVCLCLPCQCALPTCDRPCQLRQPLGEPQFYCQGWDGDAPGSCPALAPNAGTPCNVPPDAVCRIGACGQINASCVNGIWRWSEPTRACSP